MAFPKSVKTPSSLMEVIAPKVYNLRKLEFKIISFGGSINPFK